ncbi:MAG: type II toxin-antitoxin system prevent-host-death family antitoxin [Gammaproteobacteria bacterium]|nr:type II toxin-antitoxin system prevent-host-death family antitoxin [Gammaproteobacteria bacterium]
MTITTVTGRDFNQDIGGAKRAAAKSGPVFVTNRGKTTQVLLSIEDYQRISARGRSLVEALAMPGLADIDFEPPKMKIEIRPADLS